MKIAQVSPLYERVPPRGYGGTERVVFWLTEELAAQGHQVTLFASGDVVIESLACGTPVVAYRQGSIPEILDDGESGFIVDNLEDAVAAVGQVSELQRRCCRQIFEERFCSVRMVRDYLQVYTELLDGPTQLALAARGAAG